MTYIIRYLSLPSLALSINRIWPGLVSSMSGIVTEGDLGSDFPVRQHHKVCQEQILSQFGTYTDMTLGVPRIYNSNNQPTSDYRFQFPQLAS